MDDVIDVVRRLEEERPDAPLECYPLTPRQKEVARRVICGLGNKAVAYELMIGESTVKCHLTQIYLVTGVTSRCELMAKFLGRSD